MRVVRLCEELEEDNSQADVDYHDHQHQLLTRKPVPNMRVEDVEDWVCPVLLRFLDVSTDLVPPGRGQHRDLLTSHNLGPLFNG